MLRFALCLVGFCSLAFLGACSRTFTAVNPRPSVVIEAEMGRLALDLGSVPDTQSPADGATVEEFRKTLATGFRNMAGSNFTADAKQASLVLKFDQAELSHGNLGNLGKFMIIRYKAGWYGGDGNKIVAFAGVAEPRNPTETSERHLEDVVEVMYEQCVQALEKVQGVKTRE
jgi:hypothetical protein